MIALLAAGPAWATAVMCSVVPLGAHCEDAATSPDPSVLRFRIQCQTSSAPPGGPVSVGPTSSYGEPVTVMLSDAPVAGPIAAGGACVEGTYEVRGAFVPGFRYGLRPDSGSDLVGGWVRVGPDPEPLRRCQTNPDTCLASADVVPADLAPWLRFEACVRGQPCAPARADGLDPRWRARLELACPWSPEACDWRAEVAPDGGWGLAGGPPPAKGRIAGKIRVVQVVHVPADQSAGWRDGALVVTASALASSDRADDVVATWSDAGLTLRDARGRLLWTWSGPGIRQVTVRPDGAEILVRFATMAVRVSLVGDADPVNPGYDPPPALRPVVDTWVVRADGWPAVGVRVTVPGEDGPPVVLGLDGHLSMLAPRAVPVTLRFDDVDVEVAGDQVALPDLRQSPGGPQSATGRSSPSRAPTMSIRPSLTPPATVNHTTTGSPATSAYADGSNVPAGWSSDSRWPCSSDVPASGATQTSSSWPSSVLSVVRTSTSTRGGHRSSSYATSYAGPPSYAITSASPARDAGTAGSVPQEMVAA